MSVRRYYPTKDTSIANADPGIPAAFSASVALANVGASEILNLYRTTEQLATASILIAFPALASTGSQVVLKLFDAQHSSTLPSSYTVTVRPLEQDWDEGAGLDMDYYTDSGTANWSTASAGVAWAALTGATSASYYFQTGHEDPEIDVTSLVAPFGYRVDIASSASGYYIKKFHSRQTHFLEKRPFLEVRAADWNGTFTTSTFFTGTVGPWSGSLLETRFSSSFLSGGLVSVTNSLVDPTGVLDFNVVPARTAFGSTEVVTFLVRARPHDWNPAAVPTATLRADQCALQDAYYRVVDDESGMELLPFGTGSTKHTKLSWDDYSNNFTFRMDTVPPGKICRFDFGYNISGSWTVVQGPKFRVR